jgi:hypothetical protein
MANHAVFTVEQEKRARKLVCELDHAGVSHGLIGVKGGVVMRGPGAPYSDSPLITFDESDLRNAVELGLLEKQTMHVNGKLGWEWYVSKRKVRVGDSIILEGGARRKIFGIEQGVAYYGNANNDLVPCMNLVPTRDCEANTWEVDRTR